MTDVEMQRRKAICEIAGVDDIGDLSDGFHTFKQLYYQRMILFATIVKQNKDRAWKSLRHEDGELCFGGGWFIVGIDTPEGSYTYHYEDNYFSLFDCKELERGKHWDGHTEKDVTRLLSMPSAQPDHNADVSKKVEGDCISRQAAIDALDVLCQEHRYRIPGKRETYSQYNEAWQDALDRAEVAIGNLPSVQPEWDIPIKPVETTDTAWGIPHRQAVCPKCDYYLGHVAFLGDYKGKKVTYCETCGQAIDWEGWDFDE